MTMTSATAATAANGMTMDRKTPTKIPEAFVVGGDDLPFVDDWLGIEGVRLKLLMAPHPLRAGNAVAAAQAHRRGARFHPHGRMVLP
jgi:hypothetical protein